MFELNHLRCFVAVAEELHFGRAAARLNMTQPPLSRQIQLLEHLLEARLFDRSNRRVMLTPSGRALLPEAQRLLRLAESAAISIKRTAQGDAGTVTIGFTAASGYDFLPRVMRTLKAELPDVDFILHEAVTAAQFEALSANRLDIGLVRPPVSRSKYDSATVLREPMVLAVPANHRLAGQPVMDLAELGDEPVIGYSPFEARYFHDLVTRLLTAAGSVPNFVQHVSQIHSVLALVRTGFGIALVPAAARQIRFEGVTYRELTPIPGNIAELAAIWRRNLENPAALQALRIMLESAPAQEG